MDIIPIIFIDIIPIIIIVESLFSHIIEIYNNYNVPIRSNQYALRTATVAV